MKVCLRGVLKSLVAVELQLRSDSLFLSPHSKTDGIQYQIHCLLCSGLVGHNAVIIEIPDHGQVKDALAGMDVGNIRDPLCVGTVSVELPVEQVFILGDTFRASVRETAW